MSTQGLRKAILQFPEQFACQLIVENQAVLRQKKGTVACGMGGSSLVALLMRDLQPTKPIVVHRDYGLPNSPEALERSLIIVSSFSGNTEEALSSFEEAVRRNLDLAVISAGGKLLQMARDHSIPYIQLPDPGIQTNHALGLYIVAFLELLEEKQLLKEARALATSLKPLEYEDPGKQLAKKLTDRTVHIYASSWRNEALAYNWKIRLDESGKILASCNFFPELNHGEIEAVCASAARGSLTDHYFLFLQDPDEDPRIAKRMTITAQLYQEKGLPVEVLELRGTTKLQRFFSSTILADWTTYYLALHYGHDPESATFVENFKDLMSL